MVAPPNKGPSLMQPLLLQRCELQSHPHLQTFLCTAGRLALSGKVTMKHRVDGHSFLTTNINLNRNVTTSTVRRTSIWAARICPSNTREPLVTPFLILPHLGTQDDSGLACVSRLPLSCLLPRFRLSRPRFLTPYFPISDSSLMDLPNSGLRVEEHVESTDHPNN